MASAGSSLLVAIELRSPGDQLAHVARTVFDEHADRGFIAETVAGGDRVGRMQLRRIIGANGRRNAALGVAGIAFLGFCFCEDQNVTGAAQLRRRAQRGDAAADDEKVRVKVHAVACYPTTR